MPYPVLSRYALAVGACALIPLPFGDGLARRAALSRGYRLLAASQRVVLEGAPLRDLLSERFSFTSGCIVPLVWWPIKKLIKTAVFVLLVKDALDWTAEAAIRMLLVRRLVQRGALPHHSKELGDLLDQAMKTHFKSPVWRALTRRKHPVPGWEGQPSLLSRLVHQLVRYGNGPAVISAFEKAVQERLPDLSALSDDP